MEKFHFSSWNLIPMSKVWDNYVKDHHDLGLTILMSPMFYEEDDPDELIKFMDECQEYGMKVMLFDGRVTAHTVKRTGPDGATASMWMAPGQLEIIRESR